VSSVGRHGGRRSAVAASAALIIGLQALIGCASITVVRATDTVERSIEVPSGTAVRVETFNGRIEVVPGSDAEVSATVRRTGEGSDLAAAEADRDRIDVTLELVDGTAVLEARYTPSPDSIRGGRSAEVELRLPPDSDLDLRTSNAPISARDISGAIQAWTSNGPVEVTGATGALALRTSNGPMTITASTPMSVDATSSNGPITFSGSPAAGGMRFETSNGAVELRLPADAAFTIDGATSNGEVTSELPLVGTVGHGRLDGRVGPDEAADDHRITIRTSNGRISLIRA
jgi:hypothetical protein